MAIMKVRSWRGVVLSLLIAIACMVVLHHFLATRRVAQVAIETAQDSHLLDQVIGTPISMARFVHGRILEGSDGGNADLEIPVHASRGRGTLFSWEQRGRSSWHICSLFFRSSRGTEIVIVPDETTHCERE
jgi:hypothetical protein